jgi:hypothetical protein
MNHSQKVVVTPYDQPPDLPLATDQDTHFTSNKKQKHGHPQLERLTKQAKIILQLAKVDGYDLDLRIKNEDGSPVYNSNVLSLINDATSISKVLIGYDAFIYLLHKANVDPAWIVNENVKTRLLRLYEKGRPNDLPRPPSPRSPKFSGSETPPPPPPIVIENQVRGKRKHDVDLELEDSESEWGDKEQPDYKKRTLLDRWIVPPEDVPLPDDDNDEF